MFKRVRVLKRENKKVKLLRRQREHELRAKNILWQDLNNILEPLVTGRCDQLCFQVVKDLLLFINLLSNKNIRNVYDFEQINDDTFVFTVKTV